MCETILDRFTVDFEYVFFFVKNKKYWFETQYEKYKLPINRWGGVYTDGNIKQSKYLKEKLKSQYGSEKDYEESILGTQSKEKSAITEYYNANKEAIDNDLTKNKEDVKKHLKYFH